RSKRDWSSDVCSSDLKDDPQIIAYVSVTNPELEDDEVGSMITSDIFKSVVENSLHYLNVDPEEGSINDVKQVEMPDLVDKTKKEAEKALKDFDKVHFVGEGKTVKAVNVEAGKDIYDSQRIIVVKDKQKKPNIKGSYLREVYQIDEMTGMEVKAKGEGFVTKQSIKKGKAIKEASELEVTLKSYNKKEKKKKRKKQD